MKILHIGSHCIVGGAEMFMADLMRVQRASGMQADAIFSLDCGAVSQFPAGCRVMIRPRSGLRKLLLDERFSVLHCCAHSAGWAAPAIRDAHFGGAVVVTSHALDDFADVLPTQAVIAVSRMGAERIAQSTGSRARVIHNGVDTGLFHPPERMSGGQRIVAWVARSSDTRKGLELLLALAVRELRDQFQLVVVDGSAPGTDCGVRLPPGAVLQARKPRSEMPEFYRQTAASRGFLLSTSSAEACPMTILEAMACGCPVIAPAVGGIPELLEHRVTGYLYQREAEGAVAEAIQWLYAGSNYEEVARAALRHVTEHHTLERMWHAYRGVYRRALYQRLVPRALHSLRWRAGHLLGRQ